MDITIVSFCPNKAIAEVATLTALDTRPVAILHIDIVDIAAIVKTIEDNGAAWDAKPAKDSDSDEKKAFKKLCADAEAELKEAIQAFKKTFD